MGEPFKVGDAVYLVAYGNMWDAKHGVVKSVHKTGNFTIEGEDGQFRQGGSKTGNGWYNDTAHHATPEFAADVAAAKAERWLKSHLSKVAKAILNAPADRHAAIVALLSDELLALLGVTR